MTAFKKPAAGYATLLASIVITIGILVVSLAISNSSFLGRFETLGVDLKDTAFYVSKSCLEYARLKLSTNPSYTGSEVRNVGGYYCTILPIETPNATEKVIKSKSTAGNRASNLKLTIIGSTLGIVSLEEF